MQVYVFCVCATRGDVSAVVQFVPSLVAARRECLAGRRLTAATAGHCYAMAGGGPPPYGKVQSKLSCMLATGQRSTLNFTKITIFTTVRAP